MEKRGALTKILAIAGTALVWFPILLPILFAAASLVSERILHFDYLMPAELFPFALGGGLLLLWAALRAHAWRRFIGWGLGCTIGLPVVGAIIANTTGLASGETEPVGWPWALVLAAIAGYCLAVVAMGVGGVLLLWDLFKTAQPPVDRL
jgi:hypothetical protein